MLSFWNGGSPDIFDSLCETKWDWCDQWDLMVLKTRRLSCQSNRSKTARPEAAPYPSAAGAAVASA